MSATYEPGTLAVATVRGVPNVRVMAGYGTAEPRLRWVTTDERLVDETNEGWWFSYQVTDMRPLVTLDPSPALRPEWLRNLAVEMRRDSTGEFIEALADLADQIEAQTRPPKPAVFEHLTAGVGDIAHALCGKVWRPNPADSVTVVGRCPECVSLAESGWIA